ncbi:enterobactin exporter EntS [bacterium BMS3Abin07]|nr:enterobactin exporter EntS [bacterium BMS3Abin07]GBE32302.1 enterobactin exporter EntS [bacterium BMS3Bbin05]
MSKDKDKVLPALRVRDFRLFWISQIISLSGTWMQHVAIGWLVYSITKSPFYLGLVMTFLSAPIMMFTLFGGIFADRHSKRNIIIATQLLSIIPAFLLGLLTQLHIMEIRYVFILVSFIGLLNAFDIPARQSFFVEMVGKGKLLNAIALNSAAFNAARIIGPFVGGIIIARFNLQACFYINSFSFLPAVIALYIIRDRGVGKISGHKSVLKELSEGLLFVRQHHQILFIFITITFLSLFGIPYSSFLPVIAEDILKTGAEGLGRLAGSAGAGAFTAAMIIALKGTINRRFLYMSFSLSAASMSIFIMTFSRLEPLSLALLFMTGFGIVSFLANANNFIQQSVPDYIRGRVMSAYILVFLGMSPIGNFVIGALAEHIGTMNALRISSIVCIGISIFFIRNGRLWEEKT